MECEWRVCVSFTDALVSICYLYRNFCSRHGLAKFLSYFLARPVDVTLTFQTMSKGYMHHHHRLVVVVISIIFIRLLPAAGYTWRAGTVLGSTRVGLSVVLFVSQNIV